MDPFIQEPGNSQSMNPYSYVLNNPLAGTDPSGYKRKTSRFDGSLCGKSARGCDGRWQGGGSGKTVKKNGGQTTINIKLKEGNNVEKIEYINADNIESIEVSNDMENYTVRSSGGTNRESDDDVDYSSGGKFPENRTSLTKVNDFKKETKKKKINHAGHCTDFSCPEDMPDFEQKIESIRIIEFKPRTLTWEEAIAINDSNTKIRGVKLLLLGTGFAAGGGGITAVLGETVGGFANVGGGAFLSAYGVFSKNGFDFEGGDIVSQIVEFRNGTLQDNDDALLVDRTTRVIRGDQTFTLKSSNH